MSRVRLGAWALVGALAWSGCSGGGDAPEATAEGATANQPPTAETATASPAASTSTSATGGETATATAEPPPAPPPSSAATGVASGPPPLPGLPPAPSDLPPTVTLFEDPMPAAAAFRSKLGPSFQITHLLTYPTYMTITAQDPAQPANLDAYVFRADAVSAPTPQQLSARDREGLPKCVFPFGSIDFNVLPRIKRDAEERLAADGRAITHVSLQKCPFYPEPTWRVYLSGPRSDGSVTYDMRGTMQKVWE